MIKRNNKTSKRKGLGNQAGTNRSLFRDVVVIYLLTFFLSLPFYFWKLHVDLSILGEDALSRINSFVDNTAASLQPLLMDNMACTPGDVGALRKTVFLSYRVKEIGLINQDNRVYCTSNLGRTSIRIFPSTIARWPETAGSRTLSLTRAKTGKTQSFFIYLRGQDGMGANALIPPDVLTELVGKGLQFDNLPFVVTVAGKPHLSAHNSIDVNEARHQVSVLNFSSPQYPLELEFLVTPRFKLHYLIEQYWISILLGSVFSLIYAYASHRRVLRQSLPATFEWALKNRELEVYFQPIVDPRIDKPLGFELLLRWQHPVHGMISPLIFIPLAEQLGKISALTDFVLDTAIDFIRDNEALMESRYLSVNISRHSLLDHEFADRICQRCNNDRLITKHLLLEVTEELAFSESEMVTVIAQLNRLQACGFRIAVDDFGTGYSGLDLIRRFPFDVVKIDKVFIKELVEEGTAIPLLDSMIGLARRLDMSIIAEGVETVQQAESLLQRGVNYHQGFYYAKPMPQRTLLEWLKTFKRPTLSEEVELVS